MDLVPGQLNALLRDSVSYKNTDISVAGSVRSNLLNGVFTGCLLRGLSSAVRVEGWAMGRKRHRGHSGVFGQAQGEVVGIRGC